MIIHTVQFAFKEGISSDEEASFFCDAYSLAEIPGPKNFEAFRQTSKKNPYKFCLSMEFDDQEGYDFYSNHEVHNDFLAKQWFVKVDSFQEADFEILEKN